MSSMQGTCVCVCIKCYTYLGMIWPKKGVGIGLYKPRPNLKTMFFLPNWCKSATVVPRANPKHLFVYCGYLFFTCMYHCWIIFWFIFPFCYFFGTLDFCHFCVRLYIFFTVDNLSGNVNTFSPCTKVILRVSYNFYIPSRTHIFPRRQAGGLVFTPTKNKTAPAGEVDGKIIPGAMASSM